MIRSPTFVRSRRRAHMVLTVGLVSAEMIAAPRPRPFRAWGCNAMFRVCRARFAKRLAKDFMCEDLGWKVLRAPPEVFILPGAKGAVWQCPPLSMHLPPVRPINWLLSGEA